VVLIFDGKGTMAVAGVFLAALLSVVICWSVFRLDKAKREAKKE
jgi:hypothetical protein